MIDTYQDIGACAIVSARWHRAGKNRNRVLTAMERKHRTCAYCYNCRVALECTCFIMDCADAFGTLGSSSYIVIVVLRNTKASAVEHVHVSSHH